jgi:hypothetical protein
MIDGKKSMSDAAPEREGSVVLIPLRVVVEALEARISLVGSGLVEVYFAAVPSPGPTSTSNEGQTQRSHQQHPSRSAYV